MRLPLPTFLLLISACASTDPQQCASDAAQLETDLQAQESLIAGLSAHLAAVPPPALPALDLPGLPPTGRQQVGLDERGKRLVGDTVVAGGRSALCAALGTADGPVQVHIAGSAPAQQGTELLVDLHSCKRAPLEVMVSIAPPTARLDLPRPTCPGTEGLPEHGMAQALAARWQACDCAGSAATVVALHQSLLWPDGFTTSLPMQLSPSGLALGPEPGETWEHALGRWLPYLGPDAQQATRAIWFTGAGALSALDPPDVLDMPGFLVPPK